MTNWAEFLADLRSDLQDTTSATPRWTDKVLWVYAKDAIRDYSTWFPKRIDRYAMTLTAGTRALPLDFLVDIHVESPKDTYLERRKEIPGTKLKAGKYYFVEGGNLYLGSPSDEVYLTYQASRPVPPDPTVVVDPPPEEEFVFEISDADMELIRLYVKAKVYEQMRSRTAALDRFKLGSGKRDDNPLQPEVADLMEIYHQKIAERFPGGNIELYRSGRLK